MRVTYHVHSCAAVGEDRVGEESPDMEVMVLAIDASLCGFST